ncbi:hypothetical protein [Paraburkholderia aromaticivorans]|uniref:hypothetical protein n=1 Tax=Paraburkholderia aromaticivorans TaxID=2026199 RepID=UPI0038B80EA4
MKEGAKTRFSRLHQVGRAATPHRSGLSVQIQLPDTARSRRALVATALAGATVIALDRNAGAPDARVDDSLAVRRDPDGDDRAFKACFANHDRAPVRIGKPQRRVTTSRGQAIFDSVNKKSPISSLPDPAAPIQRAANAALVDDPCQLRNAVMYDKIRLRLPRKPAGPRWRSSASRAQCCFPLRFFSREHLGGCGPNSSCACSEEKIVSKASKTSNAANRIFPAQRQELIDLLKRIAKRKRRQLVDESDDTPLATLHDAIAIGLGYDNWSLFHKDVGRMTEAHFAKINAKVRAYPEIQKFLTERPIDREAATEEMREWVESGFTRLIEFAFYDPESESGFAWPSVDLNEELQAEFGDRYPEDLINDVANEMELEEGPWGDENLGLDIDGPEPEVSAMSA